MGQTLIEKITQRHAVGHAGEVRAGDYVTIRPKHVMTHDNTGAVIPKFKEIGAAGIHDPKQPVFIIDHDIQNKSEKNLAKYAKIEAFAKQHGIAFHPAGSGISHQVMMEHGYVTPGSLCVGSDSHSNMYGAVGAVGTPVVRTDAAVIWATGTFWWQVPPIVRVVLTGQLRGGASGKDVIITLCGLYNQDEVLNCAVEFTGDGVGGLSIEERMSISNMSTEWGALIGMFPYDGVAREFTRTRPLVTPEVFAAIEAMDLTPDAGASYAMTLHLDLAQVSPHVSGPNEVKVMTPVREIAKRRVKIHKAYLVSCVNSRLPDLADAAAVLEGKRVAESVELYVAAASANVEAMAKERGHWQALERAGARFLPPGCGPCIGLGTGLLEANEVGISATNRNFKGRMGDKSALCYLGSPAVVAASAAAGYITGPEGEATEAPVPRIERHESKRPAASVTILDGFPTQVTGEIVYVPKDNMNTDGIYAGEHTYRDDMAPAEMAAVIFQNYDDKFREIARPGDILVGGKNFGTGSSREQAATALKHFGIPLIVAESINQTYQRNAFNNGVICLECPGLVQALARHFAGKAALTNRPGWRVTVDFTAAQIVTPAGPFAFAALGEVPQRLVIAGGAEAVAKHALAAMA